jgi:hypothetical protein
VAGHRGSSLSGFSEFDCGFFMSLFYAVRRGYEALLLELKERQPRLANHL